jgi:6-methylsalicylate decarboxylase
LPASFYRCPPSFRAPVYLAENRDRVSAAAKQWEPQLTLDAMDAQNVATAVLSLPLPGVWFGDAQAACRMSRLCNEYAADLARSHRGRFGLFPVVPLPHTEGSLREIEYALDVLKADGIGVLTSYSDPSGSKWLGNPAFQPVFEELNRRKAIVFVHPTVPGCCQKLLPDVSPLVAEIPQDTTRAVTNLLFTGTFARFKDIRFIFTHGGGDVPMVMGRMYDYAPKNLTEVAPNGIEYELAPTVGGRTVADTRKALTLREASYPPVQYIPREDVDMTLLARTDHATYCPYKGDCAYYSIPLGGGRSTNAVWTYESPYAAVAAIRNYLAFYPDRVGAIEERPAG